MQLDAAQELRALSPEEAQLRRCLKMRTLGLASLARSIARQRSRVLYLAEGDANTRFYNLQACHRSRRNHIPSLAVDGQLVVQDEGKAHAIFHYFNNVLGTNFERTERISLAAIGLPSHDLQELDEMFTECEVWRTIAELPNDKAPGPDGFTARFYKVAWDIIKTDVLCAFNAFWSLDMRSFHLINEAYMVRLRKKNEAEEIKDYRPISLIHSFGKLITKCLANRLASRVDGMVRHN